MTIRKLRNAALGLALGVVTIPVALIAWPIVIAAVLYAETDADATEMKP